MKPPPLLFDATHTSHTRAQTGIQRVCRSLFAVLAGARPVLPVCHDPHLQGWRPLEAGEEAVLRDRTGGAGGSRGAKWTLAQKLSGTTRRWLGRRPALPAATAGFICPELFPARVGAQLPALFAATGGPRVAVFHDAIALKQPELSPPATVARLPAYLRELLLFDGVAANSQDSADTLRDYWRWLGVAATPALAAIPLGLDPLPGAPAAEAAPAGPTPRLLCVSTIEGRKNHLALLEACEMLWDQGLAFELELVGLPRPDTAGAALARIRALQQAGRPLVCHGAVAEAGLHAAYRRCTFTVYPSLVEGFGLPVLESLQHGKPCVCSGRGALGESARGGGCVPLERMDAPSLAAALRRLLGQPAELAALAAEARGRTFRTWEDYARDLGAWMDTLPRR